MTGLFPYSQDDLVKRLRSWADRKDVCIDKATLIEAADEIELWKESYGCTVNNMAKENDVIRAERDALGSRIKQLEALVQELETNCQALQVIANTYSARIAELEEALEKIIDDEGPDDHDRYVGQVARAALSGKGERCDEVTARIERAAPELAAARATISRKGK